jgi:oligopeptide/dipeptide ABC transporter ATP-binding protein
VSAHHRDDSPAPLLEVRDLRVEYRRGHGRQPLAAVDGVDLDIRAGETLGVVGESGSGKSTLGRAILGLVPVSSGTILFAGLELAAMSQRARRALSADLQAVFQDPYSSLNPTRTIGQTLAETLRVHQPLGERGLMERAEAMLARVGLAPEAAHRYPAHFSGGQRQRIAIARALIVHPRLVICDEPVSALDLSVQAQVLNLLQELQEELELSYVFVSHDLAVVRHIAHRLVVMYHGRVMEEGPAHVVYGWSAHPYTKVLLDAAPAPDPQAQARRRGVRATAPRGSVPSLAGEACPFAPRCAHAIDVCRSSRPRLERTPDGSTVACHRWREIRRP